LNQRSKQLIFLHLQYHKEVDMLGRRTFSFAAILAVVAFAHTAYAAEKSEWDGVWSGTLPNTRKVSVTILDNRVTKYSYDGAKLNVAFNQTTGDTLLFGDRSNYSMALTKTGKAAAKAIYHGRHGYIATLLTRQ
jgi:hypothetical protein